MAIRILQDGSVVGSEMDGLCHGCGLRLEGVREDFLARGSDGVASVVGLICPTPNCGMWIQVTPKPRVRPTPGVDRSESLERKTFTAPVPLCPECLKQHEGIEFRMDSTKIMASGTSYVGFCPQTSGLIHAKVLLLIDPPRDEKLDAARHKATEGVRSIVVPGNLGY